MLTSAPKIVLEQGCRVETKTLLFQVGDAFFTIRDLLRPKPSVLCPFLSFEAEMLSSGIKSSFLSLSWSRSIDFLDANKGDPAKDSNSALERTILAVSTTKGVGEGRRDCDSRISSTAFLSSWGMGPYIVAISGIPLFPNHCWKASWPSCLPCAIRVKLNLFISSSTRLVSCSSSSLLIKYRCLSKYHCWLANIRAQALWPHTRAMNIGVCPLASIASILAPYLMSSCKHFTCPSLAAWWTGVIPAFVGL